MTFKAHKIFSDICYFLFKRNTSPKDFAIILIVGLVLTIILLLTTTTTNNKKITIIYFPS